MMKPLHLPAFRKLTRPCVYIIFSWVCLVCLQSCASVKPPPKEDFQITLLEKQISEMDKKLDEIYHRVSIIQFMIDNHERKLKDLDKSNKAGNTPAPEKPIETEEPKVDLTPPGIIQEEPLAAATTAPVPQPPPELPISSESPESLYNKALTAYKNAEYDAAVSSFNAFSEKFPNHDLADNALYWAGECYYARKNYSAAIISFKKVVTRYPEGSKIPDAFLKTGYAYLAMDDKENARKFLTKVIKNFPFSPAGSKAEAMLKRIQ